MVEASHNWKAGLDVVSLVPATKIKHLAYFFSGGLNPGTFEFPTFDWAKLHNVARTFTNLCSIHVSIGESDFRLELQVRSLLGQKYIREQLLDLGKVAERGEEFETFWKCEEEGCRWYKRVSGEPTTYYL